MEVYTFIIDSKFDLHVHAFSSMWESSRIFLQTMELALSVIWLDFSS